MPRSRWHRDAHAGSGRGSRRHPQTAVTDGRGGPTCCARITVRRGVGMEVIRIDDDTDQDVLALRVSRGRRSPSAGTDLVRALMMPAGAAGGFWSPGPSPRRRVAWPVPGARHQRDRRGPVAASGPDASDYRRLARGRAGAGQAIRRGWRGLVLTARIVERLCDVAATYGVKEH